MNNLDLLVLGGTLLFIVGYGVWKTRGQKNIHGYLLGDNSLKWGTIGLSVMATQASAITFLSTPGQAYESGMGFVQNYFGLPLALIIVSAVFIPIFYRLKVYTAYEYLERRFDMRTRFLGAFLFLIQRGLAAGITIYAPSIILSQILGYDLTVMIVVTGVLVIIYTVSGGTRAVSITQKQQMAVIMGGMFVAFFIIIGHINHHVSFGGALKIAGALDKLEAVNLRLDFSERYTLWSGLTGGFFLALSYFGTDQSQVQRYLGGKNVTESRMGLMFNAILKIPMQFFILFVGVMVYVFFLFQGSPVHFKETSLDKLKNSAYAGELAGLEQDYRALEVARSDLAQAYASGGHPAVKRQLQRADEQLQTLRVQVKQLILKVDPDAELKDADFVFITFIVNYLPHGLIGLLIAVILSAAMSSTSSELNALASTTSVDFYKRLVRTEGSDRHYLISSQLFTFLWGTLAIFFALLAKNSENLIEAVNIIGSLFYGTILGIFLVAFFLKQVRGGPVFWAAILAELVVIGLYFLGLYEVVFSVAGRSVDFSIGYLWYNVIGTGITVFLALIFEIVSSRRF